MEVFGRIAADVASELWRQFSDLNISTEFMLYTRELVLEAIEKGCKELIRRGVGSPPLTLWKLDRIEDIKNCSKSDQVIDCIEDLQNYIEFLESRIAFLASDNEGWVDGYKQGMCEGKRRCIEAINNTDSSILDICTSRLKEVSTDL